LLLKKWPVPMSTSDVTPNATPLPEFEQLDRNAQKLGLERMNAILPALGHPQAAYPCIHLAGTNGKGSVAAMLTHCLMAAGYTVGTFTSPHLVDVRERILINGQPMAEDNFHQAATMLWHWLLAQYGPPQGRNPACPWPTYFEFMTLLAFQTFATAGVDVAIIEVGLGGRLDASNVLDKPLATVITSIGWDHTEFLGDTLEAIATEKAGIFRAGRPVVLGPQLPDEVRETLCAIAEERGASLVIEASSEPFYRVNSQLAQGVQTIRNLVSGETLELGLLGSYQRHNLATVLATVDVLRREGLTIEQSALKAGLRAVVWPARFQAWPAHRLIVDGSHNPDGFDSLRATLHECFDPTQGVYLLLSLKANRDPKLLVDFIAQLPVVPLGIVTTVPNGYKAGLFHDGATLRQVLRQQCPRLKTKPIWAADRVETALMTVRQWVDNHGTSHPEVPSAWGLVTGSLYTAGNVLGALNELPVTSIELT
jgi:dihydrofolate synthase / folylpolyglutamate synthase